MLRMKSKKRISEDMDPRSAKSLPIAMGIKRKASGQVQHMADGGMIEDMEMVMSVADAIRRKRMSDGGMGDLEANSEEHGMLLDDLNMEAAGEPQYDDDQISTQPENSNEHGDEIDSEPHSLSKAIRRRMMSRK